jgi:hypothetical protein
MDPIAVGAIIFSALALAASLTGLRYSKEANRIAKESNVIAQKMYEAENVPKISMSLERGHIELDGRTGLAIPRMSAVVKNEGKLLVEFTGASLAIQGTRFAYAYGVVTDNSDIEKTHPFPKFPYKHEARSSFKIPASGDTLALMLSMLRAKPEDMIVIRVVDTLGNHYDTAGWRASEFIEKRRMQITWLPPEDD